MPAKLTRCFRCMNINEIKESKLFFKKNGIYNIFLPQAKGEKLKKV